MTTETTQDQIIALNKGIAAALADRDVVRAARFFTDDGQLLQAGIPVVRGTAAIEALFREFTSGGPLYTRFETEDVVEDGDVVVDVGRYFDYGPEGPTGPVMDQGKYVGVYRRQGESLKLMVHATNSDLAASG